jgi:DtxR family Mn-dependent transcriptional regulator
MTVSEEDYLKAIYEITKTKKIARTREIARKMNVSDASASEMIVKLRKKGFVIHRPHKGLMLTEKGKTKAKEIVKRHEVIERFLSDVLKIRKDVHEEAERLEHVISKASLRKMNSLSTICKGKILRLSEIDSYQIVKVALIRIDTDEILDRLNAIGIVPGAKIEVIRGMVRGPMIIKVKGSKIAIGDDIASRIFVEVMK